MYNITPPTWPRLHEIKHTLELLDALEHLNHQPILCIEEIMRTVGRVAG